MSNLSSVSFRVDSNLKKEADALFENLGLNMTTAFNMFLRQSVREGAIPFKITSYPYNETTIKAMLEAERISRDPSVKSYTAEEAIAELNK